jgi:hypothetical protein
MKAITIIIAIFCATGLRAGLPNGNPGGSDSLINTVMTELEKECRDLRCVYNKKITEAANGLITARKRLALGGSTNEKLALLILKDSLMDALARLQFSEASDISKVRYRKGIQIIKILYEKVLSLDHHFAAVRTFNEISNLSNPNHYTEFQKVKEMLNTQTDKKKGFELTEILDKNIYTSIVSSLFKIFTSNKDRSEKTADLKNVECVIDFTLRIHQDLKTIFYETSFLQQSNDGIKINIEQLFRDYTKPIRYESSLDDCRNKDDWDMIDDLLDVYVKRMNEPGSSRDQAVNKNSKMQINLEFQIDRLLQFIALYNNFIDQGEKYYGKFKLVLNNYGSTNPCAAVIPSEYKKLADDIDIAINKFKTAYKPVEVNGSKLKELLYGINETE